MESEPRDSRGAAPIALGRRGGARVEREQLELDQLKLKGELEPEPELKLELRLGEEADEAREAVGTEAGINGNHDSSTFGLPAFGSTFSSSLRRSDQLDESTYNTSKTTQGEQELKLLENHRWPLVADTGIRPLRPIPIAAKETREPQERRRRRPLPWRIRAVRGSSGTRLDWAKLAGASLAARNSDLGSQDDGQKNNYRPSHTANGNNSIINQIDGQLAAANSVARAREEQFEKLSCLLKGDRTRNHYHYYEGKENCNGELECPNGSLFKQEIDVVAFEQQTEHTIRNRSVEKKQNERPPSSELCNWRTRQGASLGGRNLTTKDSGSTKSRISIDEQRANWKAARRKGPIVSALLILGGLCFIVHRAHSKTISMRIGELDLVLSLPPLRCIDDR